MPPKPVPANRKPTQAFDLNINFDAPALRDPIVRKFVRGLAKLIFTQSSGDSDMAKKIADELREIKELIPAEIEEVKAVIRDQAATLEAKVNELVERLGDDAENTALVEEIKGLVGGISDAVKLEPPAPPDNGGPDVIPPPVEPETPPAA